MLNEIWKDIPGYEGFYEVSNLARIRSVDRCIIKSNGIKEYHKQEIIKCRPNTNTGRHEVCLSKNGKRRCHRLYQLVALAFVENDSPSTKTTVNHKDGDINNNLPENLEWTSYSDNLKHSYSKLNRPVNKPTVNNRKTVVEDSIGNILIFDSIEKASLFSNVSPTQIRRVANTNKKTKNGYSFKIPSLSVEDIERVDVNVS